MLSCQRLRLRCWRGRIVVNRHCAMKHMHAPRTHMRAHARMHTTTTHACVRACGYACVVCVCVCVCVCARARACLTYAHTYCLWSESLAQEITRPRQHRAPPQREKTQKKVSWNTSAMPLQTLVRASAHTRQTHGQLGQRATGQRYCL